MAPSVSVGDGAGAPSSLVMDMAATSMVSRSSRRRRAAASSRAAAADSAEAFSVFQVAQGERGEGYVGAAGEGVRGCAWFGRVDGDAGLDHAKRSLPTKPAQETSQRNPKTKSRTQPNDERENEPTHAKGEAHLAPPRVHRRVSKK